MIDKICISTSNYLCKYEGMPEKDVVEYSLKFILTNIITFVLIVMAGLATDNLVNILLAALSFSFLRLFSGGAHIKNPDLCTLTSLTLVVIMGNLSKYIMSDFSIVFSLISLLLVFIYSPSKIEEHSILNKDKHYIFKVISIGIIIAGFISKSDVIQFSFFVQSITLIHIRRLKGGELIE